MATSFNNFDITPTGYVAFDALSLKSLINARLNSQNIFTDQNFEGSNISSIIDIVSYAYHVLMFYLNRTSSESTFTTAELYENINKIVKLINYNPIGYQTAILSFGMPKEIQISNDSLSLGASSSPMKQLTAYLSKGIFKTFV